MEADAVVRGFAPAFLMALADEITLALAAVLLCLIVMMGWRWWCNARITPLERERRRRRGPLMISSPQEIRALANYYQALADLAFQEGSTLERNRINIEVK